MSDQINAVFQALSRRTHLRSIPIYGGVPIASQVQRLRSRVEIVVACPGRLLDHIHQGTIRLSNVEVLVLDEADRMLDMGFLPDIREIMKHVLGTFKKDPNSTELVPSKKAKWQTPTSG